MQVIPLAEWYYEQGIGENRAILRQNGIIKKIRIERDFGIFAGPKCGAIMHAKLLKKNRSGGFILLDSGQEAVLKKWPIGKCEGQSLYVHIIRQHMWERTRIKPAIAEISEHDATQNAPTLWDEINASGIQVTKCLPHQGDLFDGWYDVYEQAQQGVYDFSGGRLIIDLNAAMTMIDIDGDDDAFILSQNAAKACAHVIDLFDIQGAVGIDFPAMEKKDHRHKVTECFDAAMLQPCERTAINGFGFMQIIMKSRKPSIIAILNHHKIANIALDALRRAEFACRDIVSGAMGITAHPSVIAMLGQYDWMDQLTQRTGRRWTLIDGDPAQMDNIDIMALMDDNKYI